MGCNIEDSNNLLLTACGIHLVRCCMLWATPLFPNMNALIFKVNHQKTIIKQLFHNQLLLLTRVLQLQSNSIVNGEKNQPKSPKRTAILEYFMYLVSSCCTQVGPQLIVKDVF